MPPGAAPVTPAISPGSGSLAASSVAPATGALLPRGAVPVTSIANDHVMVTRGKHGFRQPRTIMNLQATALSRLPKTYRGALADPNWRDAM